MLADRAVRAAHHIAPHNCAAMNAFTCAVAVDMLSGGGLKAAVSVGSGTAVNTVFFICIVLVKVVKAFWTAGSEFAGTAVYTFGHNIPLIKSDFLYYR